MSISSTCVFPDDDDVLPFPRFEIELGRYDGLIVLITEKPGFGAGNDGFHLLEEVDREGSILESTVGVDGRQIQ